MKAFIDMILLPIMINLKGIWSFRNMMLLGTLIKMTRLRREDSCWRNSWLLVVWSYLGSGQKKHLIG